MECKRKIIQNYLHCTVKSFSFRNSGQILTCTEVSWCGCSWVDRRYGLNKV